MVHIKWFYRPCEVPETVYQLLIQDRTSIESNGCNKSENIASLFPDVCGRELFISDATDTYPVSVLRGLCRVEHFAELNTLIRTFKPGPDSFFYVLGYNPETRRLASTQGEIRVGPSHQARLPELQVGVPVCTEDWEELCWRPGVTVDADLVMFLRAARSMAAFAGMCDGGSPDDGCLAASRDDTTINALSVLHDSGYDPGRALQALVKCPVPKGIDKKWSEEETKRFVKGLRQYGKNFFRIRKELLPHKETGELVEFYYLWKKTPGAVPSRTHRRHRRQSVLRRIRAPRNSRNNKEEPGDLSSASEDDNSEEDSDSRDLSGYHCRHCFSTTSKDWHHAGKEKALLCTDCRLHFKKYGDLPTLDGPKDPPYLFRPVVHDDEGRIRTRTRTKELVNSPPNSNARSRPKRGSGTSTPEPEMKISGRKSPGAASSTSSSSDKSKNKSNAASPAPRARKRGKDAESGKSSNRKKLKEDRPESPSGSSVESSLDEDNENETNDLDNDNEEIVDNENSSSRTSSPLPESESLALSMDTAPTGSESPILGTTAATRLVVPEPKRPGEIPGPELCPIPLEVPPATSETPNPVVNVLNSSNNNTSMNAYNNSSNSTVSDDVQSKRNIEIASLNEGDNDSTSNNISGIATSVTSTTPATAAEGSIVGPSFLCVTNINAKMVDGSMTNTASVNGISVVTTEPSVDLVSLNEMSSLTPTSASSSNATPSTLVIGDESASVGKTEGSSGLVTPSNIGSSIVNNVTNVPENRIDAMFPQVSSQSHDMKPSVGLVHLESVVDMTSTAPNTSNTNLISNNVNNPTIGVIMAANQGRTKSPLMVVKVESNSSTSLTLDENNENKKSLNLMKQEYKEELSSSTHTCLGNANQSSSLPPNTNNLPISLNIPHRPMFNELNLQMPRVSMPVRNDEDSMHPLIKIKDEKSLMSPVEDLKPHLGSSIPGMGLESANLSGHPTLCSASSSLIPVSGLVTTSTPSSAAPSISISAVPTALSLEPSREMPIHSAHLHIHGHPGFNVPVPKSSPHALHHSILHHTHSSVSPSSSSAAASSADAVISSAAISGPNHLASHSPHLGLTNLGGHGSVLGGPPALSMNSALPMSHSRDDSNAVVSSLSESSIYSSPMGRFYPHAMMGMPDSTLPPVGNVPDAKVSELIPNPLQSLREVKVPGYPAFDTTPMSSGGPPPSQQGTIPSSSAVSASTSMSSYSVVPHPDKLRRESHENLEKDPREQQHQLRDRVRERDDREIRDRERENRDRENRERERERERDRDVRERDAKERERSTKSSPSLDPKGQPPPLGAPSGTVPPSMGSATMTTPAGPQGPIPHPNIHLPPTSGGPFPPGPFHPHSHGHPHAHPHPLYHHYPYGPYFSPYPFPHYAPPPQQPPRPVGNMQGINQGARPPSPAHNPNSGQSGQQSSSQQQQQSSKLSSGLSESSSHGHSHHHGSKSGSGSSSSSKHSSSSSRENSGNSKGEFQQHGSHHRLHGVPASQPSHSEQIMDNHDLHQQELDEPEQIPSPHGVPRGPSPEPKVDDMECHRSQSAIFLRHWNRGDFNSCARTDMTFKPVPDSKLARKREERMRKQAEKEREERERLAQARKQVATPETNSKRETPKPGSSGNALGPPGMMDPSLVNQQYDRFTPRPGGFADTPALRQLSEYARPHTGFSPGGGLRPGPSGMLPPHPLEQMLGPSYQIGLYGPGARERLEIEAFEKREREIREIRERELSDRLKEEFLRGVPPGPGHPQSGPGGPPGGPPRMPNPLDPHWLDVHRRFGPIGPSGPTIGGLHQSSFGLYPPSGPQSTLSPLERERLERLGIPTSMGLQMPNDALTERLHAERLAMDMRLQLAAGQIPGYPGMDPLLHPGSGAYQRTPTLIPPREALGLHPDILGRPYPPDLAHHLNAHEQLQRQLLLDRERSFPQHSGGPPGLGPHPSFLAQQEEYLRQQQRDREMKVRALEEAARRH
ncbi:unnamed protein product [Allacma fusca]|nr:unnamed protein product [Allacma fusca]